MSNSTGLDARMDFRLNSNEKGVFKAKCHSMSVPHQVLLREMVQAVNEGRLKIQVTATELNKKQEIYHVAGK